jgi:trk system potassium uptake protein TrkA
MITLLKLRKGQYALVEEQVHPRTQAVGLVLRDLPLPNECALVVIIRRGQLPIPRPDLVLQPADEVLAVVHASQAPQPASLLGCPA